MSNKLDKIRKLYAKAIEEENDIWDICEATPNSLMNFKDDTLVKLGKLSERVNTLKEVLDILEYE